MESLMKKDTIKDALGISIAISPKMKKAIRSWYKAYIEESEWLNKDVESLNLPASIASEVARLATVESEINVSGSLRADYINEQLSIIKDNLKEIVETASSVGGVIFKPYIQNRKIMFDYIYQDEMFPFKFDGAGNITGVIFPSYIFKGKTKYTRLEIHDFNSTKYTIENRAFVSRDIRVDTNEIRDLGAPIPLQSVKEWEDLEEKIELEGLEKPLFSYFKIPLANNIDRKSPLGVSVYARAMKDIKKADIQAARIDWEYESKETAIDVDENMLTTDFYGTRVLPKGKERMFRTYSGEAFSESNKIKYFSPDIRDQSFYNGLNNILKRIEFNCGLAYGTLSDPQNVDKTAEEIKASKQRSWQMIHDTQTSLESAIIDLIDCMDSICTIEDLVAVGKIECVCNWSDSVIADADKERQQDMQEVTVGLLPMWKYKMKWQGLTKEEALNEIEDISNIEY